MCLNRGCIFKGLFGHDGFGFTFAGFFLSQSLGLAVEEARQVVVVVELVVAGRTLAAQDVMWG